MAKAVKRPGLMWFQGTVEIGKGGTGGNSAATALVNLGYIPASSLGKPNGPIPLVDGLIPAEYLPGVDGYIPTVLGAPRQYAGSTRTLSITNYDSWTPYTVSAVHGTVSEPLTAGSDAGNFRYTAPSEVPVGGKDSITINGVNFDIEILIPKIGKPSVTSPVENFSGMLGDIGSFTCSNYAPGSTEMLSSITVAGNIGSFVSPVGTEKIRVLNRSNVTATVSQGGVVKSIPPASELEWAGNGTWNYGVSGQVQVEFLRGVSAHASTDWQISTSPDFSTVMFQSLADTINKLSWANPIQQGGIYYVRVRHRDARGYVSAWSDTRRIVPTGLPTRQTSFQTSWSSLWYTNWITYTPTPTQQTSVQTDFSTAVNTTYDAIRQTSTNTDYYQNTSVMTSITWLTSVSYATNFSTSWLTEHREGSGREGSTWTENTYYNTARTTTTQVNTFSNVATIWTTYGGLVNTSWDTGFVDYRNTSWSTIGVTEWATVMPPTARQTTVNTSYATSTNTAYSNQVSTSISTLVSTVGNTEYAFATNAMTLTPWSTMYVRQTLGLTTVVTSGYGQAGNGCRYTEEYTYKSTSYPVSTSGLLLTAWSTVGIRSTTYIVSANTSWNTTYSGVRNTSWQTTNPTSWSTIDDYQQNTSLQTSQNTAVMTEKSTLI